MKELIEIIKEKGILQFIKFCLIGVSNTAVSYASYLVIIAMGGHYVAANIVGYVMGTINAFIWNNQWVFKAEPEEKRNVPVAFLKMIVSYAGTGVVINNILLVVWVRYIGISKVIAPLINSIITMMINFAANKFWVFRNKNHEEKNRYL